MHLTIHDNCGKMTGMRSKFHRAFTIDNKTFEEMTHIKNLMGVSWNDFFRTSLQAFKDLDTETLKRRNDLLNDLIK